MYRIMENDMKPVERLHIDELKRVEKQAGMLLKSWRRLQKESRDLDAKFTRLSEQHEAAQAAHANTLAEREEAHREALAALQTQWQEKYDRETAALEADCAAKSGGLQEEIVALKSVHLQEMEALREEQQLAIEALRTELARERKVKAAMVARIRGVTDE